MWMVAFRDLAARRRRLVIAIAATALVFAITLLLSGISASMRNESSRVIRAFGVDSWVVAAGAQGPFTSTHPIPASLVEQVASAPGVTAASPVVVLRQTALLPKVTDLNVIGYEPGRLVEPPVAKGRALKGDGEIVVNSSIGKHVGDTVTLSSRAFRVVGVTHGLSYMAGTAVTFVSLHDAQQLLYGGAPLATTIVTHGVPRALPPGVVALTNRQTRRDMARPVHTAAATISFLNVLLWIIAAGIIGAILYMSALERTRDFAVMKATGASNGFISLALGVQALVLAVASAAIAIVVSFVLAPIVPLPVEIPAGAYALLLAVAVVVGLVSSGAGLRRTMAIDPALAFG